MIELSDIDALFELNLGEEETYLRNEERLFESSGIYRRSYTYLRREKFEISNTLEIYASIPQSKYAFSESRCWLFGFEDANYTCSEIKEVESKSNDDVKFFLMQDRESKKDFGSIVYIRNATRLYRFSLAGVYFQNFAELEENLGKKIQKIFSREPEYVKMAA